jgi:hypothetical protein
VTDAVPAAPARRSVVLLAASLAGLAILLEVTLILMGIPAHQNDLAAFSQDIATAPPLAVLGFLIVRQQPHNRVGWLMLTAAAGLLLTTVGAPYVYMVYRLGYRLPIGPAALVLGYSWVIPTGALVVAVFLFPDGHLPSPRWRWAARTAFAAAACYQISTYAAVGYALASRNFRTDSTGGIAAVDNPGGWLAIVDRVSIAVLAGCTLSFVVAQLLSWRRSESERRLQLKWLLAGAAAFLVSGTIALPASVLDPSPSPVARAAFNTISALGWVALPVCMGVAILKYRLYDIDRIISRTLAYAVVTALLAGLYAGLVVLATQVLDLTSQVAVAAATLAAAALFNPVRRRVQHRVDRRFNRARYDADNTVAAFAARLQDATDPDAVRSDLIGTVDDALEPSQITLWLTGGTV